MGGGTANDRFSCVDDGCDSLACDCDGANMSSSSESGITMTVVGGSLFSDSRLRFVELCVVSM